MNDPNAAETAKRAYQLQNIEKQQLGVQGSGNIPSPIRPAATIANVADLFATVKQYDSDFKPNQPSKAANSDGIPLVVYHGTNTRFDTFVSQSGVYWFSAYEDYAEAMMEERGGGEIKDFLGLAEKIKAVYAGLKPDSAEARYVLQMKESIDQFAQLFAEGVMAEKVEKSTAESSGVKYSLREFGDGTRFVDVEMDIHTFDGMTVAEMNKTAKAILMERFAGKVIGLENRAFVNGDSVNEYLHPSKSIDMDTRKAKLSAAGELDNLLDAGTALPNKPDGADGHVHPDAIDFSYYRTIFKVGNEYFEGIVNIKNIKRGKLLKDVTKIKNITKDIVSSYGNNPKSNFLRDASMDSIRKDAEEVKKYSIPYQTYAAGNDSQRHQMVQNMDGIRFSRRKKSETEVLQAQNEKLREDVNRLKELVKLQGKVTHGSVFKASSVEAAARYLKKLFHTEGDTKELAQKLNSLYGYIASDPELTWEGVKEQAVSAAQWLQDNEKFQRDQYAQDVLDTLKGQSFRLDDTQLGEVKSQYGSLKEYRRAVKNMASGKSSQSLDQLWQELSRQYPDIFPEETSASDMPLLFADALERLEGMESTETAMDWRMKDAAMLEAVYDSYWRVSGMETVADRYTKKMTELRGRHYEKMTELRKDRDQKLKELRESKKQSVKAVRENRNKAA